MSPKRQQVLLLKVKFDLRFFTPFATINDADYWVCL